MDLISKIHPILSKKDIKIQEDIIPFKLHQIVYRFRIPETITTDQGTIRN